ncbi:uncharacterized protein LOC143599586 [Bidens hawaiensis]|uniref:uncharacterized protein LOC143599586 n=1 Tax=Bidens hawaiensis TaxID=980011 RepID=UPI00404A18D2
MDYDSDSQYRYSYSQFSRRLLRSLQNPLDVVHRSNADFFILGATGNVYTVTLSNTPSCNCPDPTTPCKHILFLYVCVLSVPQTDPILRQKTLTPPELTRLLSAPVSEEAFACQHIRDKFLELYEQWVKDNANVSVDNGAKCSVCCEAMGVDDRKLVACRACKNPIHEGCVISRWKWQEIGEESEYINLSKYLSDDEDDYED